MLDYEQAEQAAIDVRKFCDTNAYRLFMEEMQRHIKRTEDRVLNNRPNTIELLTISTDVAHRQGMLFALEILEAIKNGPKENRDEDN